MQTDFELVWSQHVQEFVNHIEKWFVFGLTVDRVQLEHIECNHCVHLKILQRQMCVKSRSKHMQTDFELVWSQHVQEFVNHIEKWFVFGLTVDRVQLEHIECNHCVHLKILQRQMCVKSRSKHMQTDFELVWSQHVQEFVNHIEKWFVFGLTVDRVQLEHIECNHCVHLKILQRQMCVKSRSKHMQTDFELVWSQHVQEFVNHIEKWFVFGLTVDRVQLEHIECNHCVHLKILQRQMCVKSRSKHMQTDFELVWSQHVQEFVNHIEKWFVFGLTVDRVQLEHIECNHCVHLKILQRQMCVKSRSKHMQTDFEFVCFYHVMLYYSLLYYILLYIIFIFYNDFVFLFYFLFLFLFFIYLIFFYFLYFLIYLLYFIILIYIFWQFLKNIFAVCNFIFY